MTFGMYLTDVFAGRIRLGAEQPPKAMEQVDEDEEDENLTDEQRGEFDAREIPGHIFFLLLQMGGGSHRH